MTESEGIKSSLYRDRKGVKDISLTVSTDDVHTEETDRRKMPIGTTNQCRNNVQPRTEYVLGKDSWSHVAAENLS